MRPRRVGCPAGSVRPVRPAVVAAAWRRLRAGGLGRGALYLCCAGKQGLCEAVFDELGTVGARRIARASGAEADPWRRALAALDAFLDVCCERDYREIVLLQGPI